MPLKDFEFGPGNQAAAGVKNRGDRSKHKPVSDAAREMWVTRVNQVPEGWPADRKEWTNAQVTVERAMTRAHSGDVEALRMLVERAEGKVPMAPEDREAVQGTNAALLGGLGALQALRMALGLVKQDAIDSEIVPPGEIGDGVIR